MEDLSDATRIERIAELPRIPAALSQIEGGYLVATQDGRLATISSPDGREHTLFESGSEIRGHHVAETGVYFTVLRGADPDTRLLFYDFATQTATELANLGANVLSGASISPDERFAIYSAGVLSGADIMLLDPIP